MGRMISVKRMAVVLVAVVRGVCDMGTTRETCEELYGHDNQRRTKAITMTAAITFVEHKKAQCEVKHLLAQHSHDLKQKTSHQIDEEIKN